MSNRREFVLLALRANSHVRGLCRRFGISPKTGYKWIQRYRQQGEAGLEERSRRPHHSPARSDEAAEQRIVALHRAYPCWGARKLRSLLPEAGGRPHHSTVEAVLKRQGCQVQSPPLGAGAAPGRFEHAWPNELWQMDFKGHFPLLDARAGRCHPLTLIDDHSRYALCLKACADERGRTVQAHLIEVFRRYGLPRRITADNGPPWGSTMGHAGLSALEVWLIRLGIRVSHSRPYHPQTQGKLERFHQTLKRELLARTGFATIGQCQHELDQWRHRYNQQRPHQALGQHPPLSRYQPSARAYPETLPPIEYEPGDWLLTVRTKGQIQVRGRNVFVGEGLVGQQVALRPTQRDGVFDIVFIYKTLRQIDFTANPGPD